MNNLTFREQLIVAALGGIVSNPVKTEAIMQLVEISGVDVAEISALAAICAADAVLAQLSKEDHPIQ